MDLTSWMISCCTCLGWCQVWQTHVPDGRERGRAGAVVQVDIRLRAFHGGHTHPTADQGLPEFVQERSASISLEFVVVQYFSGSRLSEFAGWKASFPNCWIKRNARAKAMTLMMAGVPDSNLFGPLAQMTRRLKTSRAVPPPVSKGTPLGKADLRPPPP